MRQKTELETMAAERHVNLLVDALEKAKGNGGVWLNPDGHSRPKMYPNSVNVSPFNALVMALHTDANSYKTPLYLSFNTAKDQNLSVMKGQKGVPFIWYNWDTFVNRENPEDKISRDTYKALPESVRENYKATQKREVRTVFNLDQTTFPHKEKDEYEKLLKEYGSKEMSTKDEAGLKTQVSHFLLTMRDNLVKVEHKNELPHAQYDSSEDTVSIPNAKNYGHYADFAQDAIRQIMLSTGYEQRLARVSRPTPEAIRQEALISELATGIKMAELGLPARISKENLEHIDYWKRELQENPCLIDILERDVNKALDIVSRAERGEKIEYASKERQDLVKELSTPEINSQECAILLDIIRREGEIDPRNFRYETHRKAFMEKFDLNQFETEIQKAKAELSKPDLSEDERDKAEEDLREAKDGVVQRCTERMPDKWNDKSHNFFIQAEISEWLGNEPKVFAAVLDNKTKIADVILPSGANVKTGQAGVINLDRIEHALMKYKDASYVRFFNVDGFMGYKPDDNYFKDKELSYEKTKGWGLETVGRVEFDDAVIKANKVIFDQAQMMKDDDGKWMFYLKAHGEEGFAIHPDSRDLNQFFTTIKQGDDKAINEIRDELSQKYYLLGKTKPWQSIDIFNMDVQKKDVDRITSANIFRTKEGRLMMIASIDGLGKQRPREIKQSQWQRLWLAPDMAAYKNNLAAKIYQDVLHPEQKLEEGEKISPVKGRPSRTQETSRPEENTKADAQVKTKPGTEDGTKEKPKADTIQEAKAGKGKEKEEKEDKKDTATVSLTPMIRQFLDLKKKHPDALLLFRCGDFYETYMQDAQKSAEILGITLTRSTKTKGPDGKLLEMAGFPYHALDSYLPKLIRAGQRVAICDQIEPRQQQEQKPERNQPEQSETQSRGMRR